MVHIPTIDSGFYKLSNLRTSFLKIFSDFMVWISDGLYSPGLQKPVSYTVVLQSILAMVLGTVQLNGQFSGGTIKIYDIAVNDLLPQESDGVIP
jgi:hypothetical protein